MEDKSVSIRIPAELYKKIEDWIKDKQEGSAADYIVAALEKHLERESLEAQKISEDEDAKIKERLKALGYMD